MIEFHKIWIDQCACVDGIKERYGAEKALGYLVGEKLRNFVEASDTGPDFVAELPNFVAEVKRIFEPDELRDYLENVRRIGATDHALTDEQFESMRKAGAFMESPVTGAEDVLIMERIKEMLLD